MRTMVTHVCVSQVGVSTQTGKGERRPVSRRMSEVHVFLGRQFMMVHRSTQMCPDFTQMLTDKQNWRGAARRDLSTFPSRSPHQHHSLRPGKEQRPRHSAGRGRVSSLPVSSLAHGCISWIPLPWCLVLLLVCAGLSCLFTGPLDLQASPALCPLCATTRAWCVLLVHPACVGLARDRSESVKDLAFEKLQVFYRAQNCKVQGFRV
jgi:hypothetical protein